MATTSKVRRWQDKLQSATSELVPILKHQLGIIVTGGDPLAIQRTSRTDLDAQLQHRNFGTGTGATYDGEAGRAGKGAGSMAMNAMKAPRETMGQRSGLLIDDEVDGERGRTERDREEAEGELIPSFLSSSGADGRHKKGGDDEDLDEIRGLFAATLLGAQDPISRSFGGNTFALVALGSLLSLIETREKTDTRQKPLR